MSNWQGFKRTKLGQNLQAKIDAGLTKFTITKLGIGDGTYQGNVENMIALSNKKQDLHVSKIEVNENVIKIQTTITNTGVTEKYQMTEIGIFATDPEMGEILYAVMTDPNPDTMPACGSATVVKKTWTFNLIVDNTGDVSAVIDSASLITVGDLANHNNDTNAHTALAATIDDTIVPKSDTNTIRNLLDNLANRIKTATGASGWKEAPAATLASLSKMITNLATGADVTWDGKKFTNHRLGITGLMDQNGYIYFGPNFGGLIIQWVYDTQNSDTLKGAYTINIPISMNFLGCATSGTGDDSTNIIGWSTTSIVVKTFQSHMTDTVYQVRRPFHAILIGKK